MVKRGRLRPQASEGGAQYEGETDWSGRISCCGDEMMRVMLYEAAQSMLLSSNPILEGPGADSEEKQEPAIDINIEPWTV